MRYEGTDDVVSFKNTQAVGQTDMAVRVKFEGGNEEWIPQSRIHDDSEVWQKGQTGKLVICRAAAERRGLA